MPLVPEFLAGRTPPDLYHTYLRATFEPWTDALLESLAPHGAMVDLACGTGLVSRHAAALPNVTAIEAVDVAEPMIAKARSIEHAAEEKIRYSVASALELPFDADSFDCAACQQGLQFFPDKLAALQELRRVLKPGARSLISTWCSTADGLPAFAAFEQAVADELGADLVPFGPFAFGDKTTIAELADEAGFSIVSLEAESRLCPLPDARTFVLFDLAFLGRPADDGTLQPILDFENAGNDRVIETIIERVEAATTDYRQADGSLMTPMRAHILQVDA